MSAEILHTCDYKLYAIDKVVSCVFLFLILDLIAI